MIPVPQRLKVVQYLTQLKSIEWDKAFELEGNVYDYLHDDTFEYIIKAQQMAVHLTRRPELLQMHTSPALVRLTVSDLTTGLVCANVDAQEAHNESRERQLLTDCKSAALSTAQGVLQCKQCQSYRIDLMQRQSRSADEGMDTYCRCLDCHKRWRMD